MTVTDLLQVVPTRLINRLYELVVINIVEACDVALDACDVTLSVYPHLAGLKNMPACPRWESNLRPLEY